MGCKRIIAGSDDREVYDLGTYTHTHIYPCTCARILFRTRTHISFVVRVKVHNRDRKQTMHELAAILYIYICCRWNIVLSLFWPFVCTHQWYTHKCRQKLTNKPADKQVQTLYVLSEHISSELGSNDILYI